MPANRATFLALCVVVEAEDQSRRGKVAPSLGLRLALAHLYDASDRRGAWFDREPYDAFWKAATQDDRCDGSAGAFGRRQQLTAALNAIARAAGMELDVTADHRLRAAIRGSAA